VEGGGWLWILVAIGTVALGAVIAIASNRWRASRLNRSERAGMEDATRENYREGG
jgi:HAMP domain-containing protein